MNRDLHHFHDLLAPDCGVLALGEPTHQEPAFGWVRNELLFLHLAGRGFRSVALETDRIAALAVDDYVRHGTGTLDGVLATGFSHGFGDLDANRSLVARLRAHNAQRPPVERIAFHGFDAPTENTTAPSPRRYLEHARDYLGLELDVAALTGPDERWERTEAILDAAASPGASPEAQRLRVLADDLLNLLHERAPGLIAAGSHAAWLRARAHLTTCLGLLRYHAQAAVPGLEQGVRIARLLGSRDTLMARNLREIREAEARRGPTLVFAHNEHLKRTPSAWSAGEWRADWTGAGMILEPLLAERYVLVVGSLGRSPVLGLPEPAPGTFEAALQRGSADWELTDPAAAGEATARRTDTLPRQGYFPLDRELLDGADALLHVADGAAVARALG
ncbi:erythromycin esterase family protein [Streptomyces sp. Y1]|uniref:Erythromycin esterase family protein n=1 Tax=Streptomyces sp. Y1 TaxID=3238634 RepID=A0AB39TBW7_9ACTN